jgi:hypothetical protein
MAHPERKKKEDAYMALLLKPKLAFRNKTPEEKIVICQKFLNGLARLPEAQWMKLRWPQFEDAFGAAHTVMSEVARLRSELSAAIRERNRAIRKMCLTARSTSLGCAIQAVNDPAALLSLGLEVPAPRRLIGLSAAPRFLRAERGAKTGTILFRWKRPVRRCTFIVEFTSHPTGQKGWKQDVNCTKAKCLVKDLEPGRLYWFRVSVINAAGQSAWSQMVSARPD